MGGVVSIRDEEGREIARGLSNFSREDLERIWGMNSARIAEVLGVEAAFEEVVHRDNLVVVEQEADRMSDLRPSDGYIRLAGPRRGRRSRPAHAGRRRQEPRPGRDGASASAGGPRRSSRPTPATSSAAGPAGLSAAMLDRLALDERRIDGAPRRRSPRSRPSRTRWARRPGCAAPRASPCRRSATPIGVVASSTSRGPNVTVDAAALCLKIGQCRSSCAAAARPCESNRGHRRGHREATAGARASRPTPCSTSSAPSTRRSTSGAPETASSTS